MVGKKSGKALLREEGTSLDRSSALRVLRKLLKLTGIGLERTDNNMEFTSWPAIAAINQKNYYTEYLKRDDQILAYRLQQEENRNRMTKQAKDRDRALAQGRPVGPDGDVEMDEEQDEAQDEMSKGTKTIVIHIGSQNLRIGLASDALPKTVPMVIAKKSQKNEAEEGDGEPKPKRVKLDDGSDPEPEKQFGEEVSRDWAMETIHLIKNSSRVNSVL
jgi:actin-related protein 8